MPNRRWEVGEIALLGDRSRTNEEIARLIGRTQAAVSAQRRKLFGSKFRGAQLDKTKWNKRTLPIVHHPELSDEEKAALLGVTEAILRRVSVMSSGKAYYWRSVARSQSEARHRQRDIDELILGKRIKDKEIADITDLSLSAIRKRRYRLKCEARNKANNKLE